MAVTALVLYLTGVFLAFGWRSLAQRRATGDTGLRLDAGPPGSWWAELAFLAALVLGLAGPVAAIRGLAPIGPLDRSWLRLAGLVVALAGVTATLAAQAAMGSSGASASPRVNAPSWSPRVSSRCPATRSSPPCSPPAPDRR